MRYLIGITIVSVAVGAGVARGTGLWGSNRSGVAPSRYTDDLGHVTAVPPGSSAQEIVDFIMKRYDGSGIVSAKVGAPPSVPGQRAGIWLNFVIRSPGADERSAHAGWEADLVEGAVADALQENGLNGIAGSTIEGILPSGAIAPMGGGMGDVSPGQDFSQASDPQIKSLLEAGLERVHLTPVSIEVLHADEPAPAVIASTTDPAAAAKDASSTIRRLFGKDPPMYEGYYFEVRDQSGHPLFIQSTAFRSGAGSLWVDPTVQKDVSLLHG